MEQLVFITLLGGIITAAIWWGAVTLPGEKWQIMAVVPTTRTFQGRWQGMNLTYYGALSATAYSFAVIIFIILSTAAGASLVWVGIFTGLILAVCMPASRIVARLVEKKNATLTVGGAVFVGSLTAPLITFLINATLGGIAGQSVHVLVILAAISVAYAFGEGMGRLACLSFGCCYGKPLNQCSPRVRKLFRGFCLVFHGKTKKIAYASNLDGQQVIPIQVITAILYNACALVGTWLFLAGHFGAALVETLVITQVWRIVSEFFRADFRGKFTVTPYQVMAGITILLALVLSLLPVPPADLPRLYTGLDALWSPGTLLAVEFVWVVTFLFTGRSSVTGARITFNVQEDKI